MLGTSGTRVNDCSVREYSNDSNETVMDYILPLYLVSVSPIITCFCLIDHGLLQVAKIPAPLWWKECL